MCPGHSTSICVSHQMLLLVSLYCAAEAGHMTGRNAVCVIVDMNAWTFSYRDCVLDVMNSW